MEIKVQKYMTEGTKNESYKTNEKQLMNQVENYLNSKNISKFQKGVIYTMIRCDYSKQNYIPFDTILKSVDYYISNFDDIDIVKLSKKLFKDNYQESEGVIAAWLYDKSMDSPSNYLKNNFNKYKNISAQSISPDEYGHIIVDDSKIPTVEAVIVKNDRDGEKSVGQVQSLIIPAQEMNIADPCLGAAFDLSCIANIWDKIGMGFGFLKDRLMDFMSTKVSKNDYSTIEASTNKNITNILNTLANTTAKMASKVFDSNDNTDVYKQIRDAIFENNPDLINSNLVNYMKVACNTIINFDDIKEIIRDSLYKIIDLMTGNVTEETKANLMSKVDMIIDALSFKEVSECTIKNAEIAGADCSMLYNAINLRNGELETRLKAANITGAYAEDTTVQNVSNNTVYHSPFEGYSYNIAAYTNLVTNESNTNNEFLPSQYAPDLFGSNHTESDPNKIASISPYEKILGNSFKDMECLMNTQEEAPWKNIKLGVSFDNSKIEQVCKMNYNDALNFILTDLIKQSVDNKLIKENEVILNQGQVNYIFNGQDRNFIQRAFDVITDTIKCRVYINGLKAEQNRVVEKAKEEIKQEAKKEETKQKETKEKCDCGKEGCTCEEHKHNSEHISHKELEEACNILGLNQEKLKSMEQIQQDNIQYIQQQQQQMYMQRPPMNPYLFNNFFQQPQVPVYVPMVTPQQ